MRSLVDLVRGLGIRSVAEGVETTEVAAVLLAMGCDAAQGHVFSPPLNAAAATAWLAGDQAAHPAPLTSAAAPEAPGG